MKPAKFTIGLTIAILVATCFVSTNVMAQTSPKEAQAIAKDAFIYANPTLE